MIDSNAKLRSIQMPFCNLTALGHILCVKTHDDILKKESQSD